MKSHLEKTLFRRSNVDEANLLCQKVVNILFDKKPSFHLENWKNEVSPLVSWYKSNEVSLDKALSHRENSSFFRTTLAVKKRKMFISELQSELGVSVASTKEVEFEIIGFFFPKTNPLLIKRKTPRWRSLSSIFVGYPCNDICNNWGFFAGLMVLNSSLC